MPALLLLLLCVVSLGGAAGQALAEGWTRFRGPNGSGVSKDTGFPTVFAKDKNVKWRTPARPGKSSPILTRRHIFLTAAEDGRLYTQCFDRNSGKLLWERSLAQPRKELANGLNHGAAITPVTDGDHVYVFFKDFGFVSYDREGNTRWKTPLGPFVSTQGLGASPILAGDSVVLVADQWENSYVAAFSRSSGEMSWKVSRDESDGWGTPLLYENAAGVLQLVTVSRGQLGMHNIATGRRTITLAGLPVAIVASPVLDGDTVYAFGYGFDAPAPFASRLQRFDKNKDGKLSADEYGDDSILNSLAWNAGNRDGIVSEDKWNEFGRATLGPNSLVAVSLKNGRAGELWRYTKNFTSVIPSTLAYDNVLYIVRNGGILTTHDTATGAVLKTARIEGALGGYSSSPVAAEGKIWLASEEGKVSVVRAAREWEVLAVNDLGESCYATPALSDGVIYLRTDEALYAFASDAGK